MGDSEEFDVNGILAEYRNAYETGNKVRCLQLRDIWNELHGAETLHETAFGEP